LKGVKWIKYHLIMEMPGVIIFVNDSITTATQTTLATKDSPNPSTIQGIDVQLQINETINLTEFNARIAADPNYPTVVHLNRLRILVILPNFQDTTNRNLADVVMFVKQGLASVEKCKYGPPGFTLPIQRINIFNLLYGIKTSGNTAHCFPCFSFPPPICPPPFPPPICPPQTQTVENPRPPEHMHRGFPEGLGALELFGVESLEANGIDEGVFGDQLQPEHRNPNRLPDDDDCCVDKNIEIEADEDDDE
jgi:hypothetical protein